MNSFVCWRYIEKHFDHEGAVVLEAFYKSFVYFPIDETKRIGGPFESSRYVFPQCRGGGSESNLVGVVSCYRRSWLGGAVGQKLCIVVWES